MSQECTILYGITLITTLVTFKDVRECKRDDEEKIFLVLEEGID